MHVESKNAQQRSYRSFPWTGYWLHVLNFSVNHSYGSIDLHREQRNGATCRGAWTYVIHAKSVKKLTYQSKLQAHVHMYMLLLLQ